MDSRVLTESDVHRIVRIFLEDGELVLNRERLCLAMGLTVSQLEDMKFTVAMDRSQNHGFLTLGLTKWIIINRTDATLLKLAEILRNDGFVFVADKISDELPRQEGIPSYEKIHSYDSCSVWFSVPEEVSVFTGRQKEIKEIHASIIGQNVKKIGEREITSLTMLSGLGGTGKTALAIHYAWKCFQDKSYINVIWIKAETTYTIEKSFHGLADKVGLNTIGSNGLPLELIELASRIYEHFEQASTLFVFDSVEKLEHVKPYLPIKSPKTTKQYVLITSRSRVLNRNTDLITLNVFPENDSVEFLKLYLKLETNVEIELAREIASVSQHLPSAMRRAGENIEKACSDECLDVVPVLQIYLEFLQTNCKRVLNLECGSDDETIYRTWDITLEKIKRQKCLPGKMMEVLLYLYSDNNPMQLLQKYIGDRIF